MSIATRQDPEIRRDIRRLVPAGTWRVDPSHSSVGFSVKHMMIATVRGTFNEFEGTLEVDPQGDARASGRVSAASIDTGDAKRDAHLRSADFFEASEHQELRFESRAVESLRDGTFRVSGDLTIRGVTRPVDFDVDVLGGGQDPWGNERVALEARGEIDRKEFGLNWNQALEAGGMLVGDTVKLQLDLSAIRESEQAAA